LYIPGVGVRRNLIIFAPVVKKKMTKAEQAEREIKSGRAVDEAFGKIIPEKRPKTGA
jgi:hypothetical protein